MKKMVKKFWMFSAILWLLVLFAACRAAPKFHIQEVYAGVGHVFILKDDGTLWAAGYNHFGQLGLGNYQGPGGEHNPRTVVQVKEQGDAGAPLTGIRDIAPGESHTVMLKNDGTLWVAGDHSFGALGLGQGQDGDQRFPVFTQVKTEGSGGEPIRGVRAIAAGGDTSFFIKDDGTLWAAGYNYYGALGLDTAEIFYTFTQVVSAGNDVQAVAAGNRHTVILKNDGSVWTTGHNHFGQLGLENTTDCSVFTLVSAVGTDNKAVAAGNNHTVILKNDGAIWAAGGNYSGQLGMGDFDNRSSFVRSGLDKPQGTAMNGIREIAANGDNTLVLKNDGSLWAVGDNLFGQLGQENGEDEYSQSLFVPLKAEGAGKNTPPNMRPISVGSRSIYVIGSDGSLRGAGSNRYGQLNLGDDVEDASEIRVIYP